jgi:uncharacterized protein (TIGR03643 family)
MARWKMDGHKAMLLKNPHKDKDFSDEDISRIIEMGWEDRTPFEAIELQFGLNQDGVIKVMRANLKLNSFKLWRARTHGQTTKHLKLRSSEVTRHQSRQHNKIHR